MFVLNDYSLLYENIDIIQAELFEYLNNSTEKLRLYLFTDININKKYFNSKIIKLKKEKFLEWYENKFLNTCKAVSVYLSLNASNSIRPNHYMRIVNNEAFVWEDCLNFNYFLTKTNNITYDKSRYGFAVVFIKPGQTIFCNGYDMKPYNFTKMFLLSNSLKIYFKDKEFNLTDKIRNFTYYTQSNIKICNNTNKIQYFLSSSYFMFDYDIKNYDYIKDNLKYQAPKL
jgi:hypothetical protein